MMQSTYVNRVFVAAAALSLLSISLAGCAGSQNHASPGVANPAMEPSLDDGSVMSPEYLHLANADAVESPVGLGTNASTPWAVLAADVGSQTLFVAYATSTGDSGGCESHLGLHVVETDATITIASVSAPQARDAVCDGDPQIGGGSIALNAPLGTRALYHAGLSEPWLSRDNPLETYTPSTPTPVAAPPLVPYTGTATCSSLLDAATVSSLRKDAQTDLSGRFAQRNSEPGALLRPFIENGGLVCAWGEAGVEASIVYAYGAISTDAAEKQQAVLLEAGLSPVEGSSDTYKSSTAAYGTWVFGDGYWAFASDNGGGDVIDEVVKNAPTF